MAGVPVTLFQGPRGSSDERAAQLFDGIEPTQVLSLDTLDELLFTVDTVDGTYGIIPLENNVNGEFTGVLSRLILTTEHCLVTQVRTLEEEIGAYGLVGNVIPREALVNADILPKFSNALRELDIEDLPAETTFEACKAVIERGNPEMIAFAPAVVAKQLGLVPVQALAHHTQILRTRYGLLQRDPILTTKSSRSTFLLWPKEDSVGTLSTMLEEFRVNNIDIASLRSFLFALDSSHAFLFSVNSGLLDAKLQATLSALAGQGVRVRLLGDYAIEDLLPIDTTVEKVRMLDGLDAYKAELSRLTGGKA
jgi:prephenate dehydratase